MQQHHNITTTSSQQQAYHHALLVPHLCHYLSRVANWLVKIDRHGQNWRNSCKTRTFLQVFIAALFVVDGSLNSKEMRVVSAAALVAGTTLAGNVNVDAASAGSPPNVLFILMDDWGFGDVNVYGNTASTEVKTPNIDSLAAQSVVFTNGYSASSVCSPSRAAWMTGRFPAELGIHSALPCEDCAKFLNASESPVITQVFHDSGWHVGHFGKVSRRVVDHPL